MKKYKVLFPAGKEKALTFSYDDNQIYDRDLIALMKKFHVKGTFHINTSTIGTSQNGNTFVTSEEFSNLYSGMEVSCHGVHHPYFGQFSPLEMTQEILQDKEALEALCHYPVRGMSYPFGEYSEKIMSVMSASGMEYSRTVEDTHGFSWPSNFLSWHPSCHHNIVLKDDTLTNEFLHLPDYRNLPLFYIWGHSFEFHRENTFDAFSDFLAKVADKPDVWYATNIEIKDYITAVRSLVYQADGSAVYNPSACRICFYLYDTDQIVFVNPGQLYFFR